MPPALRIPVALDMNSLRQQSQQASDHVGSVLRQIGKKFADLNGEVLGLAKNGAAALGLTWSQALVSVALRFTGLGLSAYAAFRLISLGVGEARREIADMVDIANKAQNVALSPEAFQAFVAGAKGATDQVKEFESAAEAFFGATKRELDTSISPDELDAFKAKVDAVTKAVREVKFELLPSTAQGPQTFMSAAVGPEGNDQRLLGVLQTMKELVAAGQKLEALHLAETAFPGTKIANDLRTGKLDVAEMADTMQNKLVQGLQDGSTYSNALVREAKDLDDRLAEADRTIANNLTPHMAVLSADVLAIKALWVNIVELIAKASSLIPKVAAGPSGILTPNTALPGSAAEMKAELDALQKERASLEQFNNTPLAGGNERLADVNARIARLEHELNPPLRVDVSVPLPRRRPVDIPATTTTSSISKDSFEREIDSLQKRIAAYREEAVTVGQTTEVKARYYATGQLIEALNRAGIEITPELNAQIEHLADAFGKAAAGAEKARKDFQGANEATQFFGHELENALSNIDSSTKGIDLLRSAVRDLANELVKAALTGEGAFAKILGLASNTGGTGGLFGSILGLFRGGGSAGIGAPLSLAPPGLADGGVIPPGGLALVSEHSPGGGRFVRAGSEPIMVTPNNIAPAVGASGGIGGPLFVSVTDARAGEPTSANATRTADGGVRIDVALRRHVDDTGSTLIDSGESAMNRSLERRYGLRPAL